MAAAFDIPAGVSTRLVDLRRGAIRALTESLRRLGYPTSLSCLVVQDQRTHAAAGAQVQPVLEGAGWCVQSLLLQDDPHGEVPGDRAQIDQVTRAACAADLLIGVGSGVINDLCKLAARLAERPYIAVATAASMNGYGSPIAAIVDGGVKRTLPAAVTQAIIGDLDVLAAAPLPMTRSGFADLLSKSSATADWLLAHLVRGEPYDPRPHELLEPIVRQCQAAAAAIGRAEPAALELLMRGLIGGAFSMVLAGHSSPASGGEHLLSHYWDMTAHATGGRHYLHGFQVAIGTRLCSALYHRLLRLEASHIDIDAALAQWQAWPQRCRDMQAAHGGLFQAVEPEARQKFLERDELAARLRHVRAHWNDIGRQIAPMLLTPQRLLALHEAAGVPTDPAGVGQTRALVRHTLLHAADVRGRYTVLDLARELGVLEDWADGLLDDARL